MVFNMYWSFGFVLHDEIEWKELIIFLYFMVISNCPLILTVKRRLLDRRNGTFKNCGSILESCTSCWVIQDCYITSDKTPTSLVLKFKGTAHDEIQFVLLEKENRCFGGFFSINGKDVFKKQSISVPSEYKKVRHFTFSKRRWDREQIIIYI